MASLKEIVKHKNHESIQRSLYDRRAGNDRRSIFNSEYDTTEKRKSPERRLAIKEKRLDWARDTKWSSIYLKVLR
ncbi:MAG: hypothetical protein JRI61_05795 [Deltaproteobacteria bacterium]|jgi:hypothetical protein|nr:hypothetical protein [Deltaproteobacteria bacterium]